MISLAHHNSIIGGFVAVRDGQDGFFPLLECADGQGQQLGPVLGGLEAVLAFVLRHPGEDPVRLLHGREDIDVFQGAFADSGVESVLLGIGKLQDVLNLPSIKKR